MWNKTLWRFGLTISLGKTAAMFQRPPSPQIPAVPPPPPPVSIDDMDLKTVDKFCYLGSTLSSNGSLDNEISLRISKASSSFGALMKRLLKNHGIKLHTKIVVYRAVVLSSLLYSCKTWTTYWLHMRSICNINICAQYVTTSGRTGSQTSWSCKSVVYPGLGSLIIKVQLRWAGHVVRMPDGCIPKMLLYGQLKGGQRGLGRHLHYRDTLKANVRSCRIDAENWEDTAASRERWRQQVSQGIGTFEIHPSQGKARITRSSHLNPGQNPLQYLWQTVTV